jgi:hypothetical protein
MANYTKARRQELANAAPPAPPTLPPVTDGKEIPLSQLVEPHVTKLYNNDELFRDRSVSVNGLNSPTGRTCFDDGDNAEAVREDAAKNDGHPRIINALRSELSTAVKRCLSKHGVSRAKWVAKARENLLALASAPMTNFTPAE